MTSAPDSAESKIFLVKFADSQIGIDLLEVSSGYAKR